MALDPTWPPTNGEVQTALERVERELETTKPEGGLGMGTTRDPLLVALADLLALCVRRWLSDRSRAG